MSFTASARTLHILAALVWYIGGVVLLLKGSSLLREAGVIRPEGGWPAWAIVIGIVVGSLKGLTLFRKSCHKNLSRIDDLRPPMIWQFFRPQFFFFLALMIAAGSTLSRMAHGNYGFLIGVFMAILGVIPYIGNILCLIPACIIGYLQAQAAAPFGLSPWGYVIGVVAIFVGVQQINFNPPINKEAL